MILIVASAIASTLYNMRVYPPIVVYFGPMDTTYIIQCCSLLRTMTMAMKIQT